MSWLSVATITVGLAAIAVGVMSVLVTRRSIKELRAALASPTHGETPRAARPTRGFQIQSESNEEYSNG